LAGSVESSAIAETQPPVEGKTLPEFSLPAPKDAEHKAYLGITGRETFGIADIQAEVVIIEIFSMY
jgi:hypothetical protein